MKESRSTYLDIRGLRYHVREWGDAAAPKLVLLHGWMDISASFQFVVDELEHEWHVVAPDWRGFGRTEWAKGGYWFPDYMADLDVLLDHYSRETPSNLVGHSMGGNVANLYAGIRPERVARLVLAEGFGLPPSTPEQAPGRYAKWLAEWRDPPKLRPYASFAEIEERMRQNNPRLTAERARFLAREWAEETAPGQVVLRADPLHKMVNPVLYRYEEAMACWKRITAPTLWLLSEGDWVAKFIKDPFALEAYRGAYAKLSERKIADAGHMMHRDQPRAFAQAIEEFVKGSE